MIYRLLFLAALLGIANAVESCYYCHQVMGGDDEFPKCSDGSVVKSCHAQPGLESTGQACITRWMNQGPMLQSCIGNTMLGFPDNATECGAYKCMTGPSGAPGSGPDDKETMCWCTTDNCNKDIISPADCAAQASPENGADGKVGGVFSILLFAILATIF